MQVQVRDIASDIAVAGKAHEGIQIRPVDIDLPTGGVNGVGNVFNPLLIHPVGGGVCDHQRG